MSVMAKYARIFWVDPKDEDVSRRNAAVSEVQAWMSKSADPWTATVLASSLAESVASGEASDVFALVVEQAIVAAGSAAFVRADHDLEIIVVALVSALDLISREPGGGDLTQVDVLAASLWSALSFQPVVAEEPIETLRQELLSASQTRALLIAERSRQRAHVPEVGTLTISEEDPAGGRSNAAYRRATEPLVKALRENAELDREELDFLWWMIEDWSDLLDGRRSDASPLIHAVVAGFDGASKLRRLPSSGHRNVVLRGIPDGSLASLTDLVALLGNYLELLSASVNATRAKAARNVFPLVASIVTGDASCPGGTVERKAREWGARALLEAGILHVATMRGE